MRSILTSDGLVVANSFAQSQMHERESATYAAVFGPFFDLRTNLAGNRVIIGSASKLPDETALRENATAWAQRLQPFGINVEQALSRFSIRQEQYEEALVLHDAP